MLGLGNVGGEVARIGRAFGMQVIAWSHHLTTERASEAVAVLVTKDELFRLADIVTVHLVLSRRTRGLVGKRELALMKPTALLVNTSAAQSSWRPTFLMLSKATRSPGLPSMCTTRSPWPPIIPSGACRSCWRHPTSASVSRDLYRRFYEGTIDNVVRWLKATVRTEAHQRSLRPAIRISSASAWFADATARDRTSAPSVLE